MGWIFNGKCTSKVQLDGKTAIVTGANTGIGKITAKHFAERGATVIMACRNVEKGIEAANEIKANLTKGSVIVEKLDLSSLESVRNFAKKILEKYKSIHLLINNAGIMISPYALSADGYELQFATNHLGHFLLTMLLLPTIISSSPARIVNVSSKVHNQCLSMCFDDINMEKNYSPISAYCRSKMANILFTKELAKRLEGTGVTTYSLHPGVVRTELARHADTTFFRGAHWMFYTFGWAFMKSPEQGAQTTLYCALEESLANESGYYYDDCTQTKPTKMGMDSELAKELWTKSAEMVKLGDFNPFSPRT